MFDENVFQRSSIEHRLSRKTVFAGKKYWVPRWDVRWETKYTTVQFCLYKNLLIVRLPDRWWYTRWEASEKPCVFYSTKCQFYESFQIFLPTFRTIRCGRTSLIWIRRRVNSSYIYIYIYVTGVCWFSSLLPMIFRWNNASSRSDKWIRSIELRLIGH